MPLGLTRIGLSTAPRTDYFWGSAAGATTLTAGSGSFSLGGQAASLPLSRVIAASPASLSITGQAAGFAIARSFGPLASGSLALAGQTASFQASTDVLIVADGGTFVVAGQAAAIPLSRIFAAEHVAHGLVASPIQFVRHLQFSAEPGSRQLAGQNAFVFIASAAGTVALYYRHFHARSISR